MIRKSKLYVGITLLVQAISFFAVFIILCVKKKSVAAAFLAVATLEGAAGTYMLWQYSKEKEDSLDDFYGDEFFDDDFDFDDSILGHDLGGDDEEDDIKLADIPKDEDASEEDFK